MKPSIAHLFAATAALLALGLSSLSAAAAYTETFDYYGWSTSGDGLPAMSGIWVLESGNAPTIVKSSATYPAFDTPYLNMREGVISAQLNGTLEGDFYLKVSGLHFTDGRSFWVGLFNAEGTQGYGLRWEAYATGGGSLRPVGFDHVSLTGALTFSASPAPNSVFYLAGTGLIGRPGQPANTTAGGEASASFITVGIAYSASANTLSLLIGDTIVGSVALGETSISDLSKIYIGASADVAIGNITVDGTLRAIPEPSQAGILVAMLSVTFVLFRRNSRSRRA